MSNTINLFGIPFHVYVEESLYQFSCEMLEEPILYTIVFVDADQCGYLMEAEAEIRNHQRITWVPVGRTLAGIFPKKEKHIVSEFSVRKYLAHVAEYFADTGAEMCLLMNTAQQSEDVLHEFRNIFPYLSIHTLNYDSMLSEEAVVNEINSIAPEVLILGIHMDEMKHFLENSRQKANARLCICVGDLLLSEMSKKRKMFHTISMSRTLKKKLRKYNKKEQDGYGLDT